MSASRQRDLNCPVATVQHRSLFTISLAFITHSVSHLSVRPHVSYLLKSASLLDFRPRTMKRSEPPAPNAEHANCRRLLPGQYLPSPAHSQIRALVDSDVEQRYPGFSKRYSHGALLCNALQNYPGEFVHGCLCRFPVGLPALLRHSIARYLTNIVYHKNLHRACTVHGILSLCVYITHQLSSLIPRWSFNLPGWRPLLLFGIVVRCRSSCETLIMGAETCSLAFPFSRGQR